MRREKGLSGLLTPAGARGVTPSSCEKGSSQNRSLKGPSPGPSSSYDHSYHTGGGYTNHLLYYIQVYLPREPAAKPTPFPAQALIIYHS